MNSTSLRQLIKESIQEYIREVETSGNVAAQEAKIRACDEAIALREKKLNMEGLDEAYHDMIDEAKKKNLEKEIKELQKYKKKAEKILEKMKSKAGKEDEKENVEEEGVIDEVAIDEMDPEAGPQLEEAKKKKKKEEKELMNESFLYMQKLAGVITEAEYKQKKIKLEEEPTISLEKVIDSTSKIVNKIENDPKIDAFALSIANDPKKKQELLDLSKKLGINPLNLNENMGDPAEKLAFMFAKKAQNKINEYNDNEDVTTQAMASLAGFFGGAPAAYFLAQKLEMFTNTYVNTWGETLTNPQAWVPFAGMAAGAIAGWILGEIIKKVFGN